MMRTVNSRETSKLAFIGFIILVCLTSVSAESYIWNGENNAAWDSQVLAASNDLGENSDDLTHSDVCKWLEENNQEGLENNCATVPDLGWVEVSKIITEVQSSDLEDKWIKVSKIITCVEKKDTPVKAYSCESADEIGKVVSLIKEESSQNSDGDEDNNDNTGHDGSDSGADGPSDCAEGEYYDHGFDMCLEDSDDSSDDSSEDRINEELGDLSFEIRPDPSEWTNGANSRVSCEDISEIEGGGPYRERVNYKECDVDAEFAASAGEGYIDDYRVKAHINVPGFRDDVDTSYQCEGPQWTNCHTSNSFTIDDREIDDYSATVKVQEESCRYAGRHQGERCSWSDIESEDFNNFN